MVTNVERFVQTHTLKSSTESFLLRIRNKFSTNIRSANQKPANTANTANQKTGPGVGSINKDEAESSKLEEWNEWYSIKRKEWKTLVNDRKNK